jgi:hypothetical protein
LKPDFEGSSSSYYDDFAGVNKPWVLMKLTPGFVAMLDSMGQNRVSISFRLASKCQAFATTRSI